MMDRIRAEEATIIRRAAIEYPLAQFGASARNMAAQFVQLGLTGLQFGQALVGTDEPVLVQRHPDRPGSGRCSSWSSYAGVFGSLALLAYLRRAVRPVEFAALAVAVTGLVANAARVRDPVGCDGPLPGARGLASADAGHADRGANRARAKAGIMPLATQANVRLA
jgi:hypothetical protein